MDDIEYMTGIRPGWYWLTTWRYLGPVLAILLFIAGLYDMGRDGIGYYVWLKDKAGDLKPYKYRLVAQTS